MATKSKKSKLYQTGWKVCAACILFIMALVIFFCGVVFSSITKNWGRSILTEENFYDTVELRNLFFSALDEAVLADVYYESEAKIQSGEKVDREALLAGFKRYYNIIDGVITGNTEINDTYDGLIVYGVIPERLEDKFIEYQELVETRLPQYRQMYIQDQLDEYREAVRYLEGLTNFYYFVEDEQGRVIAGNAAAKVIPLCFLRNFPAITLAISPIMHTAMPMWKTAITVCMLLWMNHSKKAMYSMIYIRNLYWRKPVCHICLWYPPLHFCCL